MRTRHRVPTLFTLSMMDVFCCALGCVILLWLWNERLAKHRAALQGDTKKLLASTAASLADARARLSELEAQLDSARKSAEATAADLKSTRADLDGARREVASLSAERARLTEELSASTADLKAARAQAASDAELLAKKRREQERLSATLSAAQKRELELEQLVRQKEDRLALSTKRTDDLEERLHEAEGLLKQLKTTADVVPGLKSDLDAASRRATAAEARARDLERDLTARRAVMLDTQGEVETLKQDKKQLSDQLAKLRLAADNRFAGIQLTGRRVVLLVDMSGSMKSTDENTPVPEKWPGVAATAAKVLKSLPDLEKFQVVVFSESAAYPMGRPGEWLDYDPAGSADRVQSELLKIVPQGNTNMYAGMEAAFNFRAKGLDAVYLLSDGLPNIGPGLSAQDQARTLTEGQRAEILGKHIRGLLKTRWNQPEIGRERVRINSIGFFYESPDVGAFLWALSRENDGSFVGMSKP